MSSSPWRMFRLAMRLYTRAPLQRLLSPPPDADIGRALAWLPVVGLLVGGLFAVIYVMLAQIVPHSVAVLIALATAVLLTGGYHEIGWMRFCDVASDGQGEPPRTPAARAVGAVGAIALLFSVLMKLESLSSLDPSWVSIAALTGHPLSRGLAVVTLTGLRTPGSGGPAVGTRTWILALVAGLLPAVLAAWWLDTDTAFASALIPSIAMTMVVRQLARHRAAADPQAVLGAGQQLTELAWYLGLLAWWTLGVVTPTEATVE